jgi:hypothetical protein
MAIDQNDTKSYESPTLTVLGSVASLTQASGGSSVTDAAFPANTPSTSFTFS